MELKERMELISETCKMFGNGIELERKFVFFLNYQIESARVIPIISTWKRMYKYDTMNTMVVQDMVRDLVEAHVFYGYFVWSDKMEDHVEIILSKNPLIERRYGDLRLDKYSAGDHHWAYGIPQKIVDTFQSDDVDPNLSLEDLWICCSMDLKMRYSEQRNDMLWWWCKVVWKHGFGEESAKMIAMLAHKATDGAFDYNEGLRVAFKRLNRLENRR